MPIGQHSEIRRGTRKAINYRLVGLLDIPVVHRANAFLGNRELSNELLGRCHDLAAVFLV